MSTSKKPSTTKETSLIPYATKIKLDDDTVDYYVFKRDFYNINQNNDIEIAFSTTTFIMSPYTSVMDYKNYIFRGYYRFDRDRYQCVTLSFIFLNENDEYEEGTPETFCGDEAHISYNSVYNDNVILRFMDVDYLESLEVVEFDNDNNKILVHTIDLTKDNITLAISQDIKDIIIREKYIDANGEVYYNIKRFPHEWIEVGKHEIFYLYKENKRQFIKLSFTFRNEGESA